VINRHDILATGGSETHFKMLGPRIPTHGNTRPAAVAKLGAGQGRRPLLRFDTRHTRQLLGQHALFQCKLLLMGQMLHAATATLARMGTGRHAPHVAGLEHSLGSGFYDFAVSAQYPRFNFFTGQCPRHKPGTPFNKGNTPAVVGQTLDVQTLFFARRHLRSLGAASRLEAQASLLLGHQLGAS